MGAGTVTSMRCPFPGMDPYLEHPALWPDVHNSLIAAIRDEVSPRVVPRYYVSLESRAYMATPDDVVLVGRPDVALIPRSPFHVGEPADAGVAVLDVDVPMIDHVNETYLEVREARTGIVVTVLEILSPANKIHSEGRKQYESKRMRIFESRTNLVEIDLLRDGEPLAVVGAKKRTDYRILVSRSWRRPKAKLYAFGVRAAIPTFPLPLLEGDDEIPVDLNSLLHDLYERAGYDLRLDYARPAVPPLTDADADWSRGLNGGRPIRPTLPRSRERAMLGRRIGSGRVRPLNPPAGRVA